MTSFQRYCEGYLRQWDACSTIRKTSRTRFTSIDEDDTVYPAHYVPVMHHPAVKALSDKTRREMMIRCSYSFQTVVADGELDVVTVQSLNLAQRDLGITVPGAARQVALTIASDEVYHAMIGREFIEDVAGATGVEPGEEVELDFMPGHMVGTRFMQENAPASLRNAAELVALCFVENFVTDELFGLSANADDDKVFQRVVREHLMDEGRHRQFFRRMLTHLWQNLDAAQHQALGELLPGFLDAFGVKHNAVLTQQKMLLRVAGFDEDRISTIVAEALAPMNRGATPGHALPHMQGSLRLLPAAGILDHGPTRRLLVDAGWVDPTIEDRPHSAQHLPTQAAAMPAA